MVRCFCRAAVLSRLLGALGASGIYAWCGQFGNRARHGGSGLLSVSCLVLHVVRRPSPQDKPSTGACWTAHCKGLGSSSSLSSENARLRSNSVPSCRGGTCRSRPSVGQAGTQTHSLGEDVGRRTGPSDLSQDFLEMRVAASEQMMA